MIINVIDFKQLTDYFIKNSWIVCGFLLFPFGVGLWISENIQQWSVSWQKLRKNVMNWKLTPKTILNYSQKKVTKFGAKYIFFAVFCFINHLISLYLWSYTHTPYYSTIITLQCTGSILCIGLLAKDYWPKQLVPFFPLYWHLTLLYCLPIFNLIMFILMQGSIIWIVNLGIAIMLLAGLVDWLTFLFLSIGGILLGFGLYKGLVGASIIVSKGAPIIDTETVCLFIYSCIASFIIGLILLSKKERDKIIPMTPEEDYGSALRDGMKEKRKISNWVDNLTLYILTSVPPDPIEELVRLVDPKEVIPEVDEGSLLHKGIKEMKELPISDFVEDALGIYAFGLEQWNNIAIDFGHDFEIWASQYYMNHLLFKLLRNVYSYADHHCKVSIYLNKKHRSLHFKDYGPGIPHHKRYEIFKNMYLLKALKMDSGIWACRRIMFSLGGYFYCKTKQGMGSYTEFVLEFPSIKDAKKMKIS